MRSNVDWSNLNAMSLNELRDLSVEVGISVEGKLTKQNYLKPLENYRDNVLQIPKTSSPKRKSTANSSAQSTGPTTPLANQQTPQKVTTPISTPVNVDTPIVEKVRAVSPVITERVSSPLRPVKQYKELNKMKFYVVFALFVFFLFVTIFLFFRQ